MGMDAITRATTEALKKLPVIKHLHSEPMSGHTSFKIGGPVRVMFFPENPDTLVRLCNLLRGYDLTPLTVGNGTNLLVADHAHDVVVIKMTGLGEIQETGDAEITAYSGAPLSEIAAFAYGRGLSGAEFMHGIPGTLGGAIMMNAGAYGCEMKDVVHATSALAPETGMFRITGAEHGFSYRSSRFTTTEDVIISSILRLHRDDKESIKARMDGYAGRRSLSQPLEFPSAGSTFKRPKEGYAAELIERAGLKGYSVGGAQVSAKHSGFVINRGAATFSDVMAVIGHVRETVNRLFGIDLEPEVRIIP